MKEKWTNDLQKKMADYEVPTIPDGLWEDIDSALSTNTQHPSSIAQYWRKACAAILLLLLIPTVLFFLYNSHTEEEGKALVEASPVAPTPQPTTVTTPNAPIAQAKAAPLSPKPYSPKPCLVLEQAPEAPAPQEKRPEEQAPENPTASPQPSLEASTPSQAQQSENTPLFQKKEQESRLYLAMNVSGTNFSFGNPNLDNDNLQNNDTWNNSPYDKNLANGDPVYYSPSNEIAFHDETHYRPITIGLQVGIPVADDWSLATGLTYSYLHSEFTDVARNNYTHTDQKMHFVGIPVQMNYQLYNNRYCNIYLGTGGRIDFGVSGKTDKESHLSHLPVNYSLKAAAGIQVNLFKSLNIYAEPTIQYNIPGSTRYKTYYTEHKTTFDLQLGIRIIP